MYITIDHSDHKLLRSYLIESISKHTIQIRRLLIEKLKTSLGDYGRELIKEFVSIDLDKITVDQLKYWFMEMILEPLEELDFKPKLIQQFLKHEVNEEIIELHKEIIAFLRNLLKTRQQGLKDNTFTYKLKYGYCTPRITHVRYNSH